MNKILWIVLILTQNVLLAFETRVNDSKVLNNVILELEQVMVVKEDLYIVEILCFENRKNSDTKEVFSKDIKCPNLIYAEKIIELINLDILHLIELKQQLETKNRYKILLHTAWKQILNFEARSYDALIYKKNLQGTIRVKVVSDLQVIIDLIFIKNGKYYQMKQTWHVDCNKVYYFDHPKFGLFIKVYK